MKARYLITSALTALLSFQSAAFAQGSLQNYGQSISHAGQSVSHVGKSVSHSAQASGRAAVGSAQLVAGVVAVPLKAVGAVGEIGGKAGDALWRVAAGQPGKKLAISDETVTAGPAPYMALNNQ